MQLAISDLGEAWKNFFDPALPDWGKPRFKSKKTSRQGFKTDRAKIVGGKLRLDKPRGIKTWYNLKFRGAKDLSGDLKTVSIYCEKGKYWASLPFEVEIDKRDTTGKHTAVDLNVGYFNYTEGEISVLPKKLKRGPLKTPVFLQI